MIVVTGAAGFIGSHVTEALVARGEKVRAVDCLTDYYDPRIKRENIAQLTRLGEVEFLEVDLSRCDAAAVLRGATAVVHQAGQPGVRSSWDDFPTYVERNVQVTRRLLEAAVRCDVTRFVYASSSSVYGAAATFPTKEDALPRPLSPYGVTKLAAEHLCGVWASEWGLATVSLRYFTVYGPRQRPDMALHRLCRAALSGTPFPLYGDGSQTRDVTEVSDVVDATLRAMYSDVPPGSVFNVAGGSQVSLMQLIEIVEELTGRSVEIQRHPSAKGDPPRTGGDTSLARKLLGWKPKVAIREGVARQLEWHTALERR